MLTGASLRLGATLAVFATPTPTREALAFVEAIAASPGTEQPWLGSEWDRFVDLCRRHDLRGNAVLGAWIAAAVQQHHEHLVTFDRGFQRLRDPTDLTIPDPAR